MTDFSKIMQQAQQVQKNIQEAQKKIAQLTVTEESVGGLVKITMNGQHFVTEIILDPSLMKESKETLEDVLMSAFNATVRKVEEKSREQMMSLMSGMDLPRDMMEQFGGGETDEG
jgi:hypothetical protein